MRPIDADAALKALRKCQTYLYDTRDPDLKIKLSSAKAAINNLPTIQPEKAQLFSESTTSDPISRQAAIDAIVQCTNCGDEDTLREYVLKHSLDNGWTGGILEALDAVKDLPPAQPEPPWISVSERLPEESGYCIITASDGVGRRTTFVKFQKKAKSWGLTGARSYWKVIAWMPLPEPYKSNNK